MYKIRDKVVLNLEEKYQLERTNYIDYRVEKDLLLQGPCKIKWKLKRIKQ